MPGSHLLAPESDLYARFISSMLLNCSPALLYPGFISFFIILDRVSENPCTVKRYLNIRKTLNLFLNITFNTFHFNLSGNRSIGMDIIGHHGSGSLHETINIRINAKPSLIDFLFHGFKD